MIWGWIIFGLLCIGGAALIGWGGVGYHQIENDLRRRYGLWRHFW